MSNNIGLVELAENMDNPEVAVNANQGRIDAALTETLMLDLSSADQSPTLDQLQTCFRIVVNTGSTEHALNLVACKKLLLVSNAGTGKVNVILGTKTIELQADSKGLFYLDGTANGLEQINIGASSDGGGGGGVEEAPLDSKLYARKNGAWIAFTPGTGGSVDPGPSNDLDLVQYAAKSYPDSSCAFPDAPTVGNTLIALVAYYGSTGHDNSFTGLERINAGGDYFQLFYRPVQSGDLAGVANFFEFSDGGGGGNFVMFEIAGNVVPSNVDRWGVVDQDTGAIQHAMSCTTTERIIGMASSNYAPTTLDVTTGTVTKIPHSNPSHPRSCVGFYSADSCDLTAHVTGDHSVFGMYKIRIT